MKKFKILKKEDLNYLNELKKLIIWSFSIFFSAVLLGFLFIQSELQVSINVLEIFEEFGEITGQSNYKLMALIFLNNTLKITAVALLGLLAGILPIIFLATNGFLTGIVAFLTKENIDWGTIFLGVLPHGIFEIPSLIVGGAIGFRLGDVFLKKLARQKGTSLKLEFKKALRFLLGVVAPVLFFASFVEVFVTKLILLI